MLIASMAICMVGCGKLSKDEAKSTVNKLVDEAYVLNEIYFGKGLQYEETGNPNDLYLPVLSIESYITKSALVEKTKEVYSETYAQSLIDMAFNGIASEVESNAVFARYMVHDDDDLLYVRKDIEPISKNPISEYDLSKTEITKISKRFIEATIYSKDNRAVEITLVRENDVFRLDTPTY